VSVAAPDVPLVPLVPLVPVAPLLPVLPVLPVVPVVPVVPLVPLVSGAGMPLVSPCERGLGALLSGLPVPGMPRAPVSGVAAVSETPELPVLPCAGALGEPGSGAAPPPALWAAAVPASANGEATITMRAHFIMRFMSVLLAA
jgi:hypothetical protein